METIAATTDLLNCSIKEFTELLQNNDITRGYLIFNEKGLSGSHKVFNQLGNEVYKMKDFKKHEAIFFKWDKEMQCVFMAFVHSTVRGQSQGGTRLYVDYDNLGRTIEDGLRLSKGMTDKNAISGLSWGGGKAIICPVNKVVFNEIDAHNKVGGKKDFINTELREKLFTSYGRFIASLNGIYIAAEDMNTSPNDMWTILKVCRFVTCLPEEVGGSGIPSIWTAEGVFMSMLASIKHFENKDDLEGLNVSIQGVGTVGGPLAELCVNSGANVIICDTDEETAKKVASYSSKIRIVGKDEIYTVEVDIFAPCAIGGILNVNTIPLLKCRYIIGAANNQLKNDEDYKLLRDKKIVYLPDFFINRIGIINCANEQYGRLEDDLKREVRKLYDDPENGTLRLLAESELQGKTPQEIAMAWASDWASIPNKNYPGRGQALIHQYIDKFQKMT
jgi:glutamate dehydrogenase/leucine dehydrogenase